jgi:hypothetical protein
MRLDKRHLLAWAAVAVVVPGACRSSAPGSGSTDSTASARTDSASPAAGANTTVRSDSVLLRTDKRQYKAGEQLTLTFENKSASSYAFNPCNRSLEREEGGSWTVVPDEGRICTMEAWILDARGTRTGTTELPSPLAPGRYRVVVRMTVESPGGAPAPAITAVSDAITVT